MAAPWWVLGDAAHAALKAKPVECARAFARLLEPDEPDEVPRPTEGFVARARLPLPLEHGPTEREQGMSLCSREKREQEALARFRVQAEAAAHRVEEAEAAAIEVERQLEEGLILPDGTPAPQKRKRPGPGRPPTSDKTPDGEGGDEGGEGGEKPPKAKKSKGGDEGAASTGKSEGKGSKGGGGEGGNAKKGKKSAVAAPTFLEANAVVEVSLRLGEAFASWYEAVLLEPGKSGKWKVQLRRAADDGSPEPLRLQGRPVQESAPVPQLRPLPPEVPDWLPTVDEFCEFFFEDGWWKVRVQAHNEDGQGGWTVVYAPAQAVHTVPRARLRPISTWDAETQAYAPIKVSGRGSRP